MPEIGSMFGQFIGSVKTKEIKRKTKRGSSKIDVEGHTAG